MCCVLPWICFLKCYQNQLVFKVYCRRSCIRLRKGLLVLMMPTHILFWIELFSSEWVTDDGNVCMWLTCCRAFMKSFDEYLKCFIIQGKTIYWTSLINKFNIYSPFQIQLEQKVWRMNIHPGSNDFIMFISNMNDIMLYKKVLIMPQATSYFIYS